MIRVSETEPAVDVLVTDLAMPKLNGIELVKRLRALGRRAALPIIAVSGLPEQHFAHDAEWFVAFILKPVDLDELVLTIKRVVTPVSR